MAVTPTRSDPRFMRIQFPTQSVDTHVYDNQRGQYHRAYPPYALMGKDLEPLSIAHMAALRRYLFFNEVAPQWVWRLVTQPTHVIMLNGLYACVLSAL